MVARWAVLEVDELNLFRSKFILSAYGVCISQNILSWGINFTPGRVIREERDCHRCQMGRLIGR
jgi:hypothetical protein